MTETRARIRWKRDDDFIDESIISIPLKSGDEAFRFIDEFEKACGGPIRDEARDKRYALIERERKSIAAKAA